MSPQEYTNKYLETKLTTWDKAIRKAQFFSQAGIYIYVMRDVATGYYRALPSYLELDSGLELMQTYFDGNVLEMAF